jgi:hypothetical protein
LALDYIFGDFFETHLVTLLSTQSANFAENNYATQLKQKRQRKKILLFRRSETRMKYFTDFLAKIFLKKNVEFSSSIELCLGEIGIYNM